MALGRNPTSRTSKFQDAEKIIGLEHSLFALDRLTETQSESDAALVAAYQHGELDAFRRLYEAHKNRVYSIALYFFRGDTASAEDATQDVFVKLHGTLGSFQSKSEFKTWLYQMVSNACIDELRKRRRLVRLEMLDIGVNSNEDESFTKTDLQSAVRDAINTLTEDARLAVLMKYFEELSYDEMAVAMKCRKGTVASRLNRALRSLADKLAFLNTCKPECDKE